MLLHAVLIVHSGITPCFRGGSILVFRTITCLASQGGQQPQCQEAMQGTMMHFLWTTYPGDSFGLLRSFGQP